MGPCGPRALYHQGEGPGCSTRCSTAHGYIEGRLTPCTPVAHTTCCPPVQQQCALGADAASARMFQRAPGGCTLASWQSSLPTRVDSWLFLVLPVHALRAWTLHHHHHHPSTPVDQHDSWQCPSQRQEVPRPVQPCRAHDLNGGCSCQEASLLLLLLLLLS